MTPGKGQKSRNGLNRRRAKKAFSLRAKCCLMTGFETDKWDVMDADVRFKGRRIEHGSSLPISDLSTHIILKNADLRLQPLKFGMAGGGVAGEYPSGRR
ncbi:AsmA family protein [Escherichia coli]